jgi:hypothetical protein
VERVLPSSGIKERLSAMAIGLAADCDDPEQSVEAIMREHLPDARVLPFVAILGPEGQWVDGFSGYKEAPAFAEVLERVEKTTVLDATPAVRKQLEKVAKTATEAAEQGNWRRVLQAAEQASKTSGRCPERDAVDDALKRARSWAEEQLAAAVGEAAGGGDLTPARQRLADVKRNFEGEPEAADAEEGRKAFLRLARIREAEARPNPAPDLRDKAAASFAGTRWAAVFVRATEAKGDDKPADSEQTGEAGGK